MAEMGEEEEVAAVEEKHSPSLLSAGVASNNKAKRKTKMPTKKKKRAPRMNRRRLTDDDLGALVSLVRSAAIDACHFLSQNDLLLHPSQAITLESSVKSAAFSLSSLHSLLPPSTSPFRRVSSSSSSLCWFQRFLSGPATADLWLQFFGLSRPSFDVLVQTLSPSLGPVADSVVAAALFRLAHAASYRAVARRFGFDDSSACRTFYRVVKALLDHLSQLLLGVPSDPQQRASILQGFERISLTNCCGALGFHRFPTKTGSIIVQALVDSEGRFLDVSAGWHGSASPSSILCQSKLYSRIEGHGELLNSNPSLELSDGSRSPEYMIGDSCCPLLRWLIVPFPGGGAEVEDDSHRVFNSVHKQGMSLIGTAFGSVKARWRLLTTVWKEGCEEMLPTVVVAGCLLHNFAHKCGELLPLPPQVPEDARGGEKFPEFAGTICEEGERVRAALAVNILNRKEENQLS